MGDHEIDVDVSDDYEDENSSQISQTVSNAHNKKHYSDENGKNSEIRLGKKKNLSKKDTQQSQKADKLSDREMRKINQKIELQKKQNQGLSDKGRKKGAKQQQGNKTPLSDSSNETESNQKTIQEGSTIQTNTANSKSSSAGKMNGNSSQISMFQQQQLQQYQQTQSMERNGIEGGINYLNNPSGLDRIANQSLNSSVSQYDAVNGMIPMLNQYQNSQFSTIQQNGSLQQTQQNHQNQQQQQFKGRIQVPIQNSMINNGNSKKDFHVIETEDDSEISATSDNQDESKSNTGMISNLSNLNQIQNNSSINNLNNNGFINNGHNLMTGTNGPVNNIQVGLDKEKRKTKLKKNKESSQNISQTSNQPSLTESAQSNIEVISTEGKHSNKQTSSRINLTNPIQNNLINNSSAAKVSFIPLPRVPSNQTNQPIQHQHETQNTNQHVKQPQQTEIGNKKILIQHNLSNNNVIQLQRKNNEDTTLLNTNISLNQQNSVQNLEESSNRQIEKQPVTQNNNYQQNIQQIQIKQSGIPGNSLTINHQILTNNNNNSQNHNHSMVNPQALPHALPPSHNMINIPSQVNTSNNSNGFSNTNINSIHNNGNNINSNNHINSNSTNNGSENLNNHNENNNNKNDINSNNNGNQYDKTQSNQSSNEAKKKKKRKNLGKAEAHALQQQQMIGQYQQQQIATPNSLQQQKTISIQNDLQEEFMFNQNSNMSSLPQSIQQQKYSQQQQGLNSPASNSNTFTQNLLGNFNSNGLNGSLNFGQQKTKSKFDVEIDQDQENELGSQELAKIGVPPSIPLGVSNQQQLIREQSNFKQSYQSKSSKNSRKNDYEYKQRMKKGPLNLNILEDQPTLFLRLSDYQEQQKKEKDEVIERHLEELNESIHSQNGQSVLQINQNIIFPVQNTPNSFLGTTFSYPQSQSTKPLLAFKLTNACKQEYEKLEANSQDNDTQTNGNNKTPVISSSNGQNSQQRSRIKKFDNSALLDKTLIIQDKITKKFKNSHYPESFKDAFSSLHSDFASTYLDPNYCTKIVSFFNRQQEFNKTIDKEEVDIDY